ncbi:MAG: hypothetical protein JSV84_14705 [Gemmatimonadota bacterium]|nr:MAG: hypothetical protein JSV84_14705 [Gemmatimonadota bacterium]
MKGAGIGLLVGAAGGYLVGTFVDVDPLAKLCAAIGGTVNGAIIGATGRNATYGFVAGMVIGGFIGGSTREGDLAMRDAILLGAGLFGEIGLILGAIAQLFGWGQYWEEVPLEKIQIGIVPNSENGFSFLSLLAF